MYIAFCLHTCRNFSFSLVNSWVCLLVKVAVFDVHSFLNLSSSLLFSDKFWENKDLHFRFPSTSEIFNIIPVLYEVIMDRACCNWERISKQRCCNDYFRPLLLPPRKIIEELTSNEVCLWLQNSWCIKAIHLKMLFIIIKVLRYGCERKGKTAVIFPGGRCNAGKWPTLEHCYLLSIAELPSKILFCLPKFLFQQ